MNIAVYCGSNPTADALYREAAQEVGTWIGQSGNALVYGGSSIGLMGAVSAAVLQAGGEVYGVEPEFFIKAGVAQHDLTELIVVDTMSERKAKMIELADVFVALPGGVGTLEEVAEIMSRIRLHMTAGPCYFLNMNGFYEGMKVQLEAMVAARFLDAEELDQFVFVESVHALIDALSVHEIREIADPEHPVVPEGNLVG